MVVSEENDRDVWFRFFIEITPDATVVVDGNGIIALVNSLAVRLLGYDKEEMVGQPIELLVPEHVREKHRSLRDAFIASASVRQMQSSIDLMAQTKSGKLVPVSIGLSPMDSSSGGQYVMASIRDNSAIHSAHLEVEAYANEIRNISRTANDAIITMNSNSIVLSWNPAAERIFGHASEDIVGEKIHTIIPSHLQAAHDAGVSRAADGGDGRVIGNTVEVEGLRSNGEIFPAELSLAKWDSAEDVIYCGIIRDITDRKNAEQMIREKEAQLRTALDNMPGAMFVVDDDLNVVLANEQYGQIYGHPDDLSVVGSHVSDVLRYEMDKGILLGSGSPEEVIAERLGSFKDGKSVTFEDRLPDDRFAQVSRRPAPDGHVVTVVTDVTALKKAERTITASMALINESIQYASRIQRAMLPSAKVLEEAFADHVVIWEPKDVVGGDIYLYRRVEAGHLLLLADCTGHGVPGAFMTMIVTGALDQALIEIPDGDPAALLHQVNQLVKAVLGQDADEGESDDGFECGLCLIDDAATHVTFAGARFELWSVRNGAFSVTKGDKVGVGYRRTAVSCTFTNHNLAIEPGDRFYLTSDGLVDQVGGKKNRAFGKRRLKKVIADYSRMKMAVQATHILRDFEEYQHTQERRDDISLIGFQPRL